MICKIQNVQDTIFDRMSPVRPREKKECVHLMELVGNIRICALSDGFVAGEEEDGI